MCTVLCWYAATRLSNHQCRYVYALPSRLGEGDERHEDVCVLRSGETIGLVACLRYAEQPRGFSIPWS